MADRDATLDKSAQAATFALSTDDTPARTAFATYCEAVSPVFDCAVADGFDPDAFRCDVFTWHLGSLMIGSFESTPLRFERSALLAAASGMDHVLFQLYRRGGFTGDADGRPIAVEAGDICLFDMLRTLRTRTTAFSNISVMVPRDFFASLGHDADSLNGVVLPAADPQTGLLADYLEALLCRLPKLDVAQAETAARSVVGLLAAVLQTRPSDIPGAASARPYAPLVEITRFIETRLRDPALGATMLAGKFAMSRATLYRHFEPLGGVSDYIRRRRLSNAALELSSPDGRRRKIADIAFRWGFANEQSFARAFKAHFGVSPGAARAEPRRGWEPSSHQRPAELEQHRFQRWLRTLRA
jgi:AraC-like DNA-binding protein